MSNLNPNPTIFNIAHRYAPVGRCIYSRDGASHSKPYDIEHIIPLSMGGRRELPQASCRACARCINRFETRFFRGTMETAREHLGLRGRQKIRHRDRLPVTLLDGRTVSVPMEVHPSALFFPKLAPPGFMMGMDPSNNIEWSMTVGVAPMSDDLHRRAARIGAPINMTRGIDALDCYRQIAKIAHAFAVAELGLGGVASLLLNLIHGQEPMLAGYSVGSDPTIEPPSDKLHEIGFHPVEAAADGQKFVGVRLRLFAFMKGSPTHYVLVGFRPPPTLAQPGLDLSSTGTASPERRSVPSYDPSAPPNGGGSVGSYRRSH